MRTHLTTTKPLILLLALVITMVVLSLAPNEAAANPKNRIDFWQNNYQELKASDDPLAARAHRIFERVLNAAGRRPGVVPRLFIVNSESDLIPLAIAIPDGGVIISKKVLTVCYQEPQRGDDRLAFLLGHEIAHQLKDDFWHMRFFQAVALSKSKNPEDSKELDEVRAMAQMTDKVQTKELQADEQGIVYAAMAGFNTRAIITADETVNFFEYMAAALDPGNIKDLHQNATYPSSKKRAVTVKARLKQVIEKTDLYDLGLLFYQSGDYEKSVLFFSEFLSYFPSREVYHNLAVSHHQKALRHDRMWAQEDTRIPFKLSLAIDPVTRAGQIHLRSFFGKTSKLYQKGHKDNEELEKAIKHYKSAIALDPSYPLAYNNLGCAMVIKGEFYKAIGLFQDASKLDPREPQTFNNLGVAFHLVGNTAKAQEYLTAARQADPYYGDPLFNLGKIAHDRAERIDAWKHWAAYLRIDAFSPWADTIRRALSMKKTSPSRLAKTKFNSVLGLKIGDYEDEVPAAWGRPIRSRDYHLKEEPFKINVYANRLMTISQDDEIIIITTQSACKGTTAQGIATGDSEHKVAAACGPPRQKVFFSKGTGWIYPSLGMALVLQDKKVVAWTLF